MLFLNYDFILYIYILYKKIEMGQQNKAVVIHDTSSQAEGAWETWEISGSGRIVMEDVEGEGNGSPSDDRDTGDCDSKIEWVALADSRKNI